ncbi:MFS transporter [Demequina capsici]|uniref:MFS transporter n=1 Tax=Demequina capsici TaxID=3075620 RepID=A0AA96FAM7_9MICO|nr:MFS transporter [Demequina sp. PMTSA13]WNM27231.1 MFS transporter [Demequina sp. PMTSA13]
MTVTETTATSAPASTRVVPAPAINASRVLAVLALGGLANFALVYFVQPLLPRLVTQFGISEGSSGLALSVTTAAMMLGLLVAGPFADRVGRARAIALSLLSSGILSIAGAFAPTWELFLVTRALAGLTLAILPAIALAVVRDIAPNGDHLRANSIYIAGTAVGGALGRLAPLPLANAFGWQSAAVVLGVLSLASGIGSLLWLPRRPARAGERPSLGVAAGLVRAVRCRPIVLTCGVGLTGMVVFVTSYNAVSFRLQSPPFDLGAAEALIYLAYLPGIVGPSAFRRLAASKGRGFAALTALTAIAASIAVLTLPTIPAIAIGLGLLTFAFLGLHSILSGWVVKSAHENGIDTSRASSVYLLAWYLGSTAAGTASTHVWALDGWTGVTAVCGVAVLASGAFAVVRTRGR